MTTSGEDTPRAGRLILITGTSGTGKRSVGSYLSVEHGFRYLSLAGRSAARRRALTALLASRREPHEDVVVTCSELDVKACLAAPRPPEIEWVWLDGDRGATRPPQLELTRLGGSAAAISARFVDPFAADGSFRPLESIVTEILASSPAPTVPPNAPASLLDPRLESLIATLGEEDGARAYIEELRWPNGATCPRCESDRIGRLEARKKYDCRACGYQFRVSAGTIFHDSHLPLSSWLTAVRLMLESEAGFPANQLHAVIGGSYKTAWFVEHRIRYAISRSLLDPTISTSIAAAHTAANPDDAAQPPLHIALDAHGALEGRALVKNLTAAAYHKPGPQHLAAYCNEARWRAANIANPHVFRETVRALIEAEPLPWNRLTRSPTLSSIDRR